MADKQYEVAIAITKAMADSIFDGQDLEFLSSFAKINPIAELPETVTTQFMASILKNADACITCWGTPAFTEELLAGAPKLRLIAHAAGSVRHLVPGSYWDTGRRITSNAPVIAEDVAQTVLTLILCSLRNFWGYARDTRDGLWSSGPASRFTTKRLSGLQVGLVGGSNVGKYVIKILKPFGCSIVLSDPFISPMEADELGARLVGLDELLSTSDVISLHAPGIPACQHMINAKNLPLVKDGALFINTARGLLIDEPALIKELETGRFFACLDVTDPEPPAVDHPFRKLENVVLTPHIAGGQTANGRKMLGRNTIKEVYNYLIKGLLAYDVRPEMMGRMA